MLLLLNDLCDNKALKEMQAAVPALCSVLFVAYVLEFNMQNR